MNAPRLDPDAFLYRLASNEGFFLRDRNDVFRLYVQGRLHVDALASLGLLLFALVPVRALRESEHLVGLAHDDDGSAAIADRAVPERDPD